MLENRSDRVDREVLKWLRRVDRIGKEQLFRGVLRCGKWESERIEAIFCSVIYMI